MLNIDNNNLIIGEKYYVINSFWDHQLKYEPIYWKKKAKRHFSFNIYKLLTFDRFNDQDYQFLDESTGWIYSSNSWICFNNENDAIKYCKKYNNNLIKELKEYAITFWAIF